MDEFIKLLDENLNYLEHEILDEIVIIYVESNRINVACPYCDQLSSRLHSIYERSFYDLPIQGKKVKVVINNRKMFCDNEFCNKTTFAERYEFLENKAKKTKRLENEILRISLNCSSLAASQLLRGSTVAVGKSTICNLLKKRQSRNN